MADVVSKSKRSQIMAAIKAKGNRATEIKFVRLLREHRINGWRRHHPIIGKPDFVFRRQHVLIFVDGCFWHGCAKHLRIPASNRIYWQNKIRRNKLRDQRTRRTLKKLGWTVLCFWEHDFTRPTVIATKLNKVLATQK